MTILCLSTAFNLTSFNKIRLLFYTTHDRVNNVEVLQRFKVQRNILCTINRQKANWTGHILCRNCLLKGVTEVKTEGRIEVTGRWGTRHTQPGWTYSNAKILKIQTGSTRSHTAENLLWNRLWTCLKTDYRMNEYTYTPPVTLSTHHI
jgi:hypothetical protein